MYQDVNFCIPTEIDAIEGAYKCGWFCGAIRFFLLESRFFCFLLTMPR